MEKAKHAHSKCFTVFLFIICCIHLISISRHLFPFQQIIKKKITKDSIEKNWKWGQKIQSIISIFNNEKRACVLHHYQPTRGLRFTSEGAILSCGIIISQGMYLLKATTVSWQCSVTTFLSNLDKEPSQGPPPLKHHVSWLSWVNLKHQYIFLKEINSIIF